MAWVMSSIGLILVAGGMYWLSGVFQATRSYTSTGETLAMLMATLPGFSTIGTGLLFMAIGAGLFRLAAIHREAKNLTDEIDRLRAILVDRL